MDDIVKQAMAKWPNVPACYEWLSLDRRGDWRLQGERVSHPGLIAFLNQHYAIDASGRCFVQNGPQQVFVDLALAPWVYRRMSAGWVSHTGQPAGAITACYLDAEGSVLLMAEPGIGLLDDRDLPRFLDECQAVDGEPASEDDFAGLLAGEDAAIDWQGIALQRLPAADPAAFFGFVAQPRP